MSLPATGEGPLLLLCPATIFNSEGGPTFIFYASLAQLNLSGLAAMASVEVFECVNCGKTNNTRGKFKLSGSSKTFSQHKWTHIKLFRCEICKKGFGLSADLTRHNAARHRAGNSMFPCTVVGCFTRFSRKDNIAKHLKRDHPQEFEAQRQYASQETDYRGNDTAETPGLLTISSQAVFDWWQSARSGHIAALESLLAAAFDINSETGDRKTALHCAARAGQEKALMYLMQRGALLGNDSGYSSEETPLFDAAVVGPQHLYLGFWKPKHPSLSSFFTAGSSGCASWITRPHR
jgi:hypothetical protein